LILVFPPEHYFQAAIQRMRQAHYLYQEGDSFALAIYVGGLAVECLLRAFKGRLDPKFDERHDLLRLFDARGMLRIDRRKLAAKPWTDEQIDRHLRLLQVDVHEIYRRWGNNYRFATEERVRAHLKEITGYQKIKGDYLKEQARRFLRSAQRFVDMGVVQWQV
jgi:HEPN domain-containing protein